MKRNLFTDYLKAVPAITPGASVGNGLVIDRSGFQTALLSGAVATMTTATFDVKIQTGDAANGSDMADYSIRGEQQKLTQLTATGTNTQKVIDLAGAKRYIRVVTASTGTVSAHNVGLILGDSATTENF